MISTPAYSNLNTDSSLPDRWAAGIRGELGGSDHNVLAWFEVDLDNSLHFAVGVIALVDNHLLACEPNSQAWQRWPLRRGLVLRHFDHAGVGTLELCDETGRLAGWRYTLGQNLAALRLIREFNGQIASIGRDSPIDRSDDDVCPKCRTPLEPGSDECPICTREFHTAPSTWTLFRLWRFARPYRGQLLAGFLLMLGSTAATLIPPYLTMPLMDDVLIPFQSGADIDPWRVAPYLGGLLAAALISWSLGWAKTYILALVSERIGADLRTATYEHLLQLSLEYFGGKRTGDLMARIGSETDRICVFLSLHST